jgi:group II intron reverse transcriptase/maturase
MDESGEFRGHNADGAFSPSTKFCPEILRTKVDLLEEILERYNMLEALKRVERNKSSGGIDGMSTTELRPYLKENWLELKESILQGQYEPQPVKTQVIPKPHGGERTLGIPTVLDRLLQQAILQVLQRWIDATFSEHSYGFRPKRSAHQAVLKAQAYCQSGREIVVDIDLEKFFDTVNHDMLMTNLYKRIGDGRVLKLIRKYLNAGVMLNGLVTRPKQGTSQGGPLSPLLSNLMLDGLDQELESRGLCFVRYADDVQIFVKTERAGERVMTSVSRYITRRLKLKVNESKSRIVRGAEYLGFVVRKEALEITTKAVASFKNKIRELSKIRGGKNVDKIIAETGPVIRGWREYFKLAKDNRQFKRLDGWIRRRIRGCQYVLYKNGARRIAEFIKVGLSYKSAYQCAYSSKGAWRMSRCEGIQKVLSNKRLKNLGLVSLEVR